LSLRRRRCQAANPSNVDEKAVRKSTIGAQKDGSAFSLETNDWPASDKSISSPGNVPTPSRESEIPRKATPPRDLGWNDFAMPSTKDFNFAFTLAGVARSVGLAPKIVGSAPPAGASSSYPPFEEDGLSPAGSPACPG